MFPHIMAIFFGLTSELITRTEGDLHRRARMSYHAQDSAPIARWYGKKITQREQQIAKG